MSLSFLTTPSKPPTSGAATGFTSLFPSTSPGGQSPFGFGSPAGNPTGGLFGSDTSKPGGNAQGAGVGSAATGGVPPRGTSPNVGAGISGSATALPFNAPTLGSDAYVNSWLEMLALHPIFHPQRSKSVPAFPSLPRTNLIASRGEDIFVSVPGSRVVRALHLPLARDAWDTLASKSGSSKSSTSVKVSAEAVHSFATSAPFVVIAPVHPAKPHPALSPLSKKKRGANLSASPDLPTEIGFDVIQLIPNQSGRLLLVIGENRIRVIVLPRSSAISTNSTSSSTPSSGTTSNSPIIACKALDIGAFDISTDASCPIVQVAWHPMSQDAAHVCVLTLDGMLRIYDLSASSDLPEQSHQLFPNPSFLPSPSPLHDPAGFCFGFLPRYSPAGKESPQRDQNDTLYGPAPTDGWGGFAVYGATAGGDIWGLCPVMPTKSVIPPEIIHLLRRTVALPPTVTAAPTAHPSPPSPRRPSHYPSSASVPPINSDLDTSLEFLETIMRAGGEGFSLSSPDTVTPRPVHLPRAPTASSQGPLPVQRGKAAKPSSPRVCTGIAAVGAQAGILMVALSWSDGAVDVIGGANVEGHWSVPVEDSRGLSAGSKQDVRDVRELMVFTPIKGGREVRERPTPPPVEMREPATATVRPPTTKKKRRGWGLHSDSEDEFKAVGSGQEVVDVGAVVSTKASTRNGRSDSDEERLVKAVPQSPTWTLLETIELPCSLSAASGVASTVLPLPVHVQRGDGTSPHVLVATDQGVFEISARGAVRGLRKVAAKVVQGGDVERAVVEWLGGDDDMTEVRARVTTEDGDPPVGATTFEAPGVGAGVLVLTRECGVVAVPDGTMDETGEDTDAASSSPSDVPEGSVPALLPADIPPDAYRSLLVDIDRFQMPRHLREHFDRPRSLYAGRKERSDEEMVNGIAKVAMKVGADAGKIQQDGIVTEGRLELVEKELARQSSTLSAASATLSSHIIPNTTRIATKLQALTKRQAEVRARADRVLAGMWRAVRRTGAGGAEMAEWEAELEAAGKKAEWMAAQIEKLGKQHEILQRDLKRRQAPQTIDDVEFPPAYPEARESRDSGRRSPGSRGSKDLGTVQEARIKEALAHENRVLVEAQDQLDTLQKELDEAMAKLNV